MAQSSGFFRSALGACLIAFVCAPLRAAEKAVETEVFATNWVKGAKSATRLLAVGTLGASGSYRAGIEIHLDPNTITYWRTPGEAGAPPAVSFEGSQNLADAHMLFPAPQRIKEAGFESFGYRRDVIFPIELTAKDPEKPVTLRIKLDYAACEKVCIPAHAQAELALPQTRMFGPFEDTISSYEARVPIQQDVGLDTPLTLSALKDFHPADGAKKAVFTVTGRAAPGTKTVNLFAEGPAGWSLVAGATEIQPDGTFSTPVTLDEIPKGGDPAKTNFTFTAVTSDRAIEVATHLDAKSGTN